MLSARLYKVCRGILLYICGGACKAHLCTNESHAHIAAVGLEATDSRAIHTRVIYSQRTSPLRCFRLLLPCEYGDMEAEAA